MRSGSLLIRTTTSMVCCTSHSPMLSDLAVGWVATGSRPQTAGASLHAKWDDRKALACISLSALVHAHSRQQPCSVVGGASAECGCRFTVETVHSCVWSVPRPNILPICVQTFTATQHLSMLQVACTALGVNHCLLKGRTFDMCIVDEAGQMTLPVALGPILHSRYGAVSSCLFDFTCTEIIHIHSFV